MTTITISSSKGNDHGQKIQKTQITSSIPEFSSHLNRLSIDIPPRSTSSYTQDMQTNLKCQFVNNYDYLCKQFQPELCKQLSEPMDAQTCQQIWSQVCHKK